MKVEERDSWKAGSEASLTPFLPQRTELWRWQHEVRIDGEEKRLCYRITKIFVCLFNCVSPPWAHSTMRAGIVFVSIITASHRLAQCRAHSRHSKYSRIREWVNEFHLGRTLENKIKVPYHLYITFQYWRTVTFIFSFDQAWAVTSICMTLTVTVPSETHRDMSTSTYVINGRTGTGNQSSDFFHLVPLPTFPDKETKAHRGKIIFTGLHNGLTWKTKS